MHRLPLLPTLPSPSFRDDRHRIQKWLLRVGLLFGLALVGLHTARQEATAQCIECDPPGGSTWSMGVTPDGGAAPIAKSFTGGHTAVFEVVNNGTAINSTSFSCGGSGGVTCTGVNPSTLVLAVAETRTVTVTYSVGAPGTGTVTLFGSGSGDSQDQGSYTVPIKNISVAVTPDGAITFARSPFTGGHSEAFTVRNTGEIGDTYSLSCSASNLTCAGVNPASVVLGAGVSTSVTVSFSAGAAGNGTLQLTAASGFASDAGSYSVPVVSYGVSVTPDGASTPARAANTGGYNESFTVTNTGSASNIFAFGCSGSGGVTCGGVIQAPTEVGPGASIPVGISYSVGAAGSGTLTLTASGTNASDAGSYTVPIEATTPPPVVAASVTPKGLAVQATPLTATTQAFQVTNSGDVGTTYTYAPICSDTGVSSCSVSPASGFLAVGQMTTVTVPYQSQANGTSGEVRLRASAGGVALDDGWVNVTVGTPLPPDPPPPVPGSSVMITPVNGIDPVARDIGTTGQVTFQVKNVDTEITHTILVDLSCTGFNLTCLSTSHNTVSLNPFDSIAVDVTFQTTVAATAAVWLNGVTQDATGSATGVWTMSVQALGPQAVLGPDGATRSVPVGITDTLGDFTLTNTGQNSPTYALTATCSGVLTTCVLLSPASVSVAAGATLPGLQVSYVAAAEGSGQVVLRASAGGQVVDSAWYNVTVTPPPPPSASATVTPQGLAVQRAPATVQVQEFQVINTGAGTTTFSFASLCSGTGVTACVLSTASATMAPGDTLPVAITYQTLAADTTGEVRLRVSAGGVDLADGWVTVTVVPAPVTATVTPDGTPVTKAPGIPDSAVFMVTNTSTSARVFTVVAACSGTGVSGCALPGGATLPQLAMGAGAPVTVLYQTGAAGTSGVVSLQALDQGTFLDSGHVVVTVPGGGPPPPPAQPAAPLVSLLAVNPGDDRPRSECVTVALGDNAAAECGDLRIVHPLPGFRTMNTDRALTLIYNSAFANPRPSIPVEVTVPTGSVVPATIQVTLASGGAPRGTWNFPGAAWSPGTPRIVRVHDSVTAFTTTQLKAYEVTVRSLFAADTLATLTAIDVPVVARRSVEFGHGWWLAGVEQLVTVGTDRLWVGGDGSTRLYRMKNSTVWEAVTVTRVDTLRLAGAEFWRQEIGGTKVFYDVNGRHQRTVNRRGHTTAFIWRMNGQLDTVYVPLPGGTRSLGYHIEALGTSTNIIEVGLTEPDSTQIIFDFGRMRDIRTPDLMKTAFTYAPGNGSLIVTRKDKRSVARSFAYDSARKVIHTALSPTGVVGDSIRVDLVPAESRGTPGTGGISESERRTVITGPRSGQVTTFEVSRFGAPFRIINALGEVTSLTRDANWPGRVVRLETPSGQILGAQYDPRGRITATADSTWSDVSGTGFATTAFQYGAMDQVSRITRPIGFIQRDINPVTGNVNWEEDSRGPPSRTTFGYGFPGNTLTRVTEPDSTVTTITPDPITGNDFWITSPKGVQVIRTLNERGFTGQSRQQIDSTGSPTINWVQTTTLFDALHRDSVVTTSVGSESVTVTTFRDPEGNVTEVRRQFAPDQKGIGVMMTRWTYDSAGRQLTETAPDNKTEFRTFDEAGNLTSLTTRLGGPPVVMAYDLLDRLQSRQVPALAYADTTGAMAGGTTINDFPALTVPTRTESFTWHPSGGVLTANNNDAQVSRNYYPNGLLESETLRVREVQGTAFPHTYVTSYEYDANLRRKTIVLPAALTEGANDRIRFTWEEWGALKTVTDPQNHTVTWAYDALGRPQTIQYPGSLSQTLGYDKDDNVTSDLVSNLGGLTFPRYGTNTLRNVAFQYDGRGKVLRSTETVGFQESTTAAYSGLGYLTNFTMNQSGSILIQAGTVPQASYTTTESYTPDGLGNFAARSRTSALVANGQTLNAGSSSSLAFTYQPGTGRLLFEGPSGSARTYVYDAAGNTTFSSDVAAVGPGQGPLEERRSFYAPDGQLRFADWRWIRQLADWEKATFEEYRYDALGRRILVRSQRSCFLGGGGPSNPQPHEFAECKAGFVRRTLWDGAQELGEIQVPGNPGEETWFEGDSFTVALTPSAQEDRNPYYGRVIYTPGLTIDRPVSILRLDYTDFPFGAAQATRWPSFGVIPQWNQRGQAQFGTFGDGAAVRQLVPNGGPCGSSSTNDPARCVKIVWPLAWSAYDQQNSPLFPVAWQGSLLEGKKDGTGTLYRRNRSYDPTAGRFTQEDPIGLAGGVNLYGFAAGDPVNFSDPFGLVSCDPPDSPVCKFILGVANRVAPLERTVNTLGEATGVNSMGRGMERLLRGDVSGGGLELALALPLLPGERVLLSGAKITSSAAKALGLGRRELGNIVEAIKGGAEMGGRDNVIITSLGNVFTKATGEFLANVFDVIPKK